MRITLKKQSVDTHTLSLTAGEFPTSVGVKVYSVSSSSTEVASRPSTLDWPGSLQM